MSKLRAALLALVDSPNCFIACAATEALRKTDATPTLDPEVYERFYAGRELRGLEQLLRTEATFDAIRVFRDLLWQKSNI